MLLIGGLIFPRLATGLGSIMLVGRELYRVGYMSPDGPNSHVREAGAIPLNIAEIIMLVMLSHSYLYRSVSELSDLSTSSAHS